MDEIEIKPRQVWVSNSKKVTIFAASGYSVSVLVDGVPYLITDRTLRGLCVLESPSTDTNATIIENAKGKIRGAIVEYAESEGDFALGTTMALRWALSLLEPSRS